MAKQTQEVPPGRQATGTLKLQLPADARNGNVVAMLKAYCDGKLLTQVPIRVTVTQPLTLRVRPLSDTPDRMRKLIIDAANTSSSDYAGSVHVGGEMTPRPVTLHMGQKTVLEFDLPSGLAGMLSADGMLEFNLLDQAGHATQMSAPVDFTVVTRVPAGLKIDGDPAKWRSIPGVHLLHGISDPKSLSAELKVAHDDANLYVAVIAHDAVHSQQFAGDLMWKGDSIQLSLDPKLARTEGAYGPDDYELGFCLSSKTHQAEAVRCSGANAEIVKHLRYAVTRDEARKVTMYEVAIPADEIAGVSLKAGSRLGLNVAIHDADATGVRKQTAEFTPGTSWPKSPSLYQPWTVLD